MEKRSKLSWTLCELCVLDKPSIILLPSNKPIMSLRSGISNFANNVRQWGLRSGAALQQFYHQGRDVANRAHPLLIKGSHFMENLSHNAGRSTAFSPESKHNLNTWSTKLRQMTDKYGVLLNKANLMHDIAFAS